MRGVEHAANKAGISHEMSTENVGSIIAANRGSLIGGDHLLGRDGRNSSTEPTEFVTGPTGDLGVNDPWNNGYDDTEGMG